MIVKYVTGESCLHLATVYGDFESVKLLVSNGAYVNQRATGRFFLPEDQKNARTNTTNYEGKTLDIMFMSIVVTVNGSLIYLEELV